MMTLKELLAQYGKLTAPPAVGDRMLFVRGEDSGGHSINLAQVKEIRAGGEFEESKVVAKGIHTFFPNGSDQRFRGRTPYSFPVSYFEKSVGEHLLAHAERWEKLAAEARTWSTSLDDKTQIV